MLKDFRKRLQEGVIVADGAMGTMLYARGIYVNQCFDALNMTSPDLVLQIHNDYVQAGAELLETNTFGANLFKLAAYGLERSLDEIITRGVALAREAAGDTAYVAGSIGPLGKPLAPLGKIPERQAFECFQHQAEVHQAAGIDLFILETFTSVREIEVAINAVREVSDLPLIAQVTFGDNLETLMGDSPEKVIDRLAGNAIDVVGANCSQGPAGILQIIEKIASRTTLPISAMPNAGLPKMVDGRFIYLSSPEYLAEYAKRFIQNGASIVGGCCGSTPSHIKAIASAVRALQPRRRTIFFNTLQEEKKITVDIVPTAQKSVLASKIGQRFIRVAEINPPRGTDATKAIHGAKILKEAGFDAVNIPDGPRASARMSPLALAQLIKMHLDMQVILHYCCRDRNILGMQSDLLGLSALGVRNLLIVTGDPPKLGDYPDATAVFDVDSIGLTSIVRGLNHGYDLTGKSIGKPTSFLIAVGANPGSLKYDEELRRLREKIDNGAELILTQPIFDSDRFERFLESIEPFRRPVLMGLLPLASYRNAEFLHNEVPGMTVPEEIRERLKAAGSKQEAQRIGIEVSRDILKRFQKDIEGVYIMPPFGRYDAAIEVMKDIP